MVAFGKKLFEIREAVVKVFRLFLKYNRALIEHKLWVLWFGIVRVGGIPLWRLFVHDLSKYHPVEYWARFRCMYLEAIPDTHPDWVAALDYHHAHNAHHWQHWVIDDRAHCMDEHSVREMVADWLAVSHKKVKEGGPPLPAWLGKEFPNMRLAPGSKRLLFEVLASVGHPKEQWLSLSPPQRDLAA